MKVKKILILFKSIIVAILIIVSLYNIYCIYNCYNMINSIPTPSFMGYHATGGLVHTFYDKSAILLTIGQIINIILLLIIGFYNKNKTLTIFLFFIVIAIIIATFFIPIYGIVPVEPNYNLYNINLR